MDRRVDSEKRPATTSCFSAFTSLWRATKRNYSERVIATEVPRKRSYGQLMKRSEQIKVSHRMRDKSKKFEDLYVEKHELGAGKYGRVLQCSRKTGGGDATVLADVAVKQLYAQKFSGNWCWSKNREVDEFTRMELEVLCALDHPNIVDFHEWFESVDRGMYFVMEFIKGRPLHYDFEEICATKDDATRWAKLPMMREYFRQIVYGVSHLHSLDPVIVHRDLKPDNLMVFKSGSDYKSHCVKLIDFGLVVNGGTAFCPSTSGARLGTRLFMAPEYILFEKGTMNPDLDMWALGIIFAWIYTSLLKGKLLHPLLKEAEAEGYEANSNDSKFRKLKIALNHGREWNGRIMGEATLWCDDGGHFAGVEHDALSILDMLLRYTPDPREEVPSRESAARLLETDWLKRARCSNDDGLSPLSRGSNDVMDNLKMFRRLASFDRLILTRSARAASEEELALLRRIFDELDEDRSGRLTLDEFTKGLRQADETMSIEECEDIFRSLAADGIGVDWNGWLSAGIGINILKTEEAFAEALQFFDPNNEGCISQTNLVAALGEEEVSRLKRQDSAFANGDRIETDKFRAVTRKIARKRSMLMKASSDPSCTKINKPSLYKKARTMIDLATRVKDDNGPQCLPRFLHCSCFEG